MTIENLQLEWAKNIGSIGNDKTNSIKTDSNDNVLVGGEFQGNIDIDGDGNDDLTSNGDADGYAAKFDSDDNLLWAKNIGGNSSETANSITTDSSDNVLIVGSFGGNIDIDGDGNDDLTSNGDIDGYAVKFDSDGNFVWAKNIGGSASHDEARSITTDSSGNVLVGGYFWENIDIDGDGNDDLTSNGRLDGYAAKFDSNGNFVWAKNIGGSSSDIVHGITTDSSDNVLVGGGYFSGNIDIDNDGNDDLTSNGDADGYAVKFNSDGNFVWAKNIGSSNRDTVYDITTDSSDNVLVGGYFRDNVDIDGDGNDDLTNTLVSDAYAAKLDSDGNFVWAKGFGSNAYDIAHGITTDRSDNVWVGGVFGLNIDIDGDGIDDLTSNGSYDVYAAKFDSNGNLVGAKNIGGSSSDIPQSITTDSSDNVLVGGGYFSNNIDIDGDGGNDLTSNGNSDGFVIKFSDGIIKGTPGRDNLTGNDGDNKIMGLGGRDTLTSGEGEDQFVYISMRDASDIITDFEVGSDKIVLTELFNSIGYSGSNPINDGYVSFGSQGENTVLLIDVDGAGGRRASTLLTVENVNLDLFNNSDNFVF